MTVTAEQYWKDKQAFFKKHEIQHIHTSQMDEYGNYVKTYLCAGNQVWTEVYSPVTEEIKVKVTVHECEIEVQQEVKFFRTEYFSTENARSNYLYENY